MWSFLLDYFQKITPVEGKNIFSPCALKGDYIVSFGGLDVISVGAFFFKLCFMHFLFPLNENACEQAILMFSSQDKEHYELFKNIFDCHFSKYLSFKKDFLVLILNNSNEIAPFLNNKQVVNMPCVFISKEKKEELRKFLEESLFRKLFLGFNKLYIEVMIEKKLLNDSFFSRMFSSFRDCSENEEKAYRLVNYLQGLLRKKVLA